VISGINHGANLGEMSITPEQWARRAKARCHHIPSVAMSLCSKKEKAKFETPRAWRVPRRNDFEGRIAGPGLAQCECAGAVNGEVKFTRQSQKITRNQLIEGKDPRDEATSGYTTKARQNVEPRRINAAIFSGAVSITPLHLDPTHTKSLNHLSHWANQSKPRSGSEA